VQLVLTLVVVLFILDRVDLSLGELGQVDLARWAPRWGILGLSCLALLAGYLFSGALWGLMVRDMGGPRIPWSRAARIYLVANLGRYIPGKLWQIAGLALLAREEGVSARVATGAAILGQGLALGAATLIGVVTLLEAGPELRPWGLGALAVLAVVCGVALVPPVLDRVTALWFRLARSEPPQGLDAGPGLVLKWGILYLVNWLVYAVSFWILVRSFQLPGTLLETAPAFAAAYVLGYVMIFAPAGIGVREGFLTALLAPVMGAATAATLAVVARLWTTGVEVVPAGVLWARYLATDGGSPPDAGESR
jgi:uncharacterized membrane protein YbhN (UPF0104 family)